MRHPFDLNLSNWIWNMIVTEIVLIFFVGHMSQSQCNETCMPCSITKPTDRNSLLQYASYYSTLTKPHSKISRLGAFALEFIIYIYIYSYNKRADRQLTQLHSFASQIFWTLNLHIVLICSGHKRSGGERGRQFSWSGWKTLFSMIPLMSCVLHGEMLKNKLWLNPNLDNFPQLQTVLIQRHTIDPVTCCLKFSDNFMSVHLIFSTHNLIMVVIVMVFMLQLFTVSQTGNKWQFFFSPQESAAEHNM